MQISGQRSKHKGRARRSGVEDGEVASDGDCSAE